VKTRWLDQSQKKVIQAKKETRGSLGERVNLNTRENRKYWTWIGGALLFVVISGSIGVSVMSGVLTPSGDQARTSETGTEVAQTNGRDGYRVPSAQPAKTGVAKNATGRAGRHSINFKNEQQKARIVASLHRRAESASEREDKLAMPEWEKIIHPGGILKDDVNDKGMFGSNGVPDFIDLYNGVEAEFIQENI